MARRPGLVQSRACPSTLRRSTGTPRNEQRPGREEEEGRRDGDGEVGRRRKARCREEDDQEAGEGWYDEREGVGGPAYRERDDSQHEEEKRWQGSTVRL